MKQEGSVVSVMLQSDLTVYILNGFNWLLMVVGILSVAVDNSNTIIWPNTFTKYVFLFILCSTGICEVR